MVEYLNKYYFPDSTNISNYIIYSRSDLYHVLDQNNIDELCNVIALYVYKVEKLSMAMTTVDILVLTHIMTWKIK